MKALLKRGMVGLGIAATLYAVPVVKPMDATIHPLNATLYPADSRIQVDNCTVYPRNTLVFTERQKKIIKLYIATFNRAPDTAGLKYWDRDSGLEIEEIAQSFFDQPETQKLYPPDLPLDDFIEAIYRNVLGRAPDQAGFDYWKAKLKSKRLSRSVFIIAVINGARGKDVGLLNNKLTVGETFVASGSNDVQRAYRLLENIDTNPVSVANTLCNDETLKKFLPLSISCQQ